MDGWDIELVDLVAALSSDLPGSSTPDFSYPGRLIAVGWATVDVERTEDQLQELAGITLVPALRDLLLGARARRARVGSLDLFLLEPSTEGKLAGWLARHGEGVAVLYVERERLDERPRSMTALERPGRIDPPRPGVTPYVVVVSPRGR
jgi:hypothetical protein